MQSPSEEARWFIEEVQPHEPTLRAYLRRRFPRLHDVDDVVQESYLKIFRARLDGRLRCARGFLFTTARNLAVDVFRRRTVEPLTEVEAPLSDSAPGVAETISRDQELQLLAEAIESLPTRCRQILKLRKIYGLSHKEIAAQFGISQHTVNVQVGRGVRRCADFMVSRGFDPSLVLKTR